MADTSLEIIISARDQFTATANRVIGSLGRISGSAGQVGRGMGQLAGGLARVGAIAATAAAGGLIAAAKAGADFEAQLRTINTIARADEQGLARIGDGLRALAREGRGDLTDLSAAFYDILSAGITDSAKALKVLDASTRLAIGGLSTSAEAVDILTTAINAYGQDASMAAHDADLFAKAIEIGKVKANEIAASFANVAPIAAQTGIEIEEIAAAYGALTAQGTPAAEVTTQMQRAILDLLNPGKELLALQKRLGVSFMEIAQEQGLVVALQQMREAVGNDDAAFKELFGRVEGYKFALQTTGPQQKVYNAALTAMGKAAGTATGQMGERTQGLAFAVGRLRNNLIDAGISVSTGFLPALTRAADRLTEELGRGGTQAALRSLGEDIGRVIDGIDWDDVLAGAQKFWDLLKGAAEVAATLLRAANALPGPLKEAGLAFLALNKLSGGLVGAGLGNIVGGLAGAGVRGAASRLPGVGAAFAQPVFVTNWPMGGLGGGGKGGPGGVIAGGGSKLGTALGALSILGSLAAVVGTQQEVSGQTSEQARGIHQTLRESLAGQPTVEDLKTKLAAIDSGIREIRSNPLLVLVQGDALAELQEMRGEVERALTVGMGGGGSRQPVAGAWAGIRGGVAEPRLSLDEQRAIRDQVAATNRVYDAVERNRDAIGRLTIPAPIVNVRTAVSVRTVVQNSVFLRRAGNSVRLHAE